MALAAAMPLAGQTTRAANADVPVTKVILFSSGVGYFEHAGTVHGNGATELRFKTAQINDILKSIMLQDQDGGRVGAISYPSQDPLAKTLRSFQVDITQNPTLAQLLTQLRGARVTIQTQTQTLTGTVLGVETRTKPAAPGEAASVSVSVLNLLTGASIRAVELPSISNLSLDDPQLQDELTKALAALVQARDQDKKPVTINFNGSGDRRVRIGYVVETPIWKTSYRLLLGDKGTRADLQGWAIVENQTESDWSGVSLALVSGRPISFMMDLYQPLYSTRPTVVPELYAGLRPQVYEGGTAAERERVMMDSVRMAPSTLRRPIGATQLSQVVTTSAISSAAANGPIDITTSVQSMAATGKLGELFQYTVPNVTLARQKSAMLPIITDSVQVERVSIYNETVLRSNPLNGVWLKNTTGKHLLQGPVTVLEKGGYAGDARIDNVPPGQDRLLSYGIDLGMTVATKRTGVETIVTAKIDHSMLTLSRRRMGSTEYSADNKTAADKMLVIEHPRSTSGDWNLVDTQKPFETTPTHYRFKGNAPANKVTTLVVKDELVFSETIPIAGTDFGYLRLFTTNGEIPKAIRDALAKAVQLRQAMLDVDQQTKVRTQQIADITAEQGRIRENMKTVAPSGPYYERLLAKLNEQESTIEKLQAERNDLAAKRDALRRELDDYVSGLTLG
ncbi:MAG: hypothetical protein JWM41_934 [Gemmatimonadetes bacterium]|nr:hypothetical protein [Gemmatimonadota bacterium]